MICKRQGHVAKDCLVFMEREGVCKRCEYPNYKYKHERPTKTPEGALAAATAQCSAATTRALPTELTVTLADLVALKDANKSLQINTTSAYHQERFLDAARGQRPALR